jgi:cardiolipin synthase
MLRHLPNLLSALRLLAAPLAAWTILAGHDVAALMLFAGAGVSDLADGSVARRWGFTSQFGAWLDPIADKLLMLLCLLALLGVGAVPFWLVVLAVARDATIAGGALLAKILHVPLRVAPLAIGKATSAVLVVYVGMHLVLLAFDKETPHLVLAAGYTVAAFILLSGAAYIQLFLRALSFGRRTA